MEERDSPYGLLKREDTALVVIDVQERLFPFITNREAVLANIVTMIRFAKLLELPIIVAEQIKLGPIVPEIRNELPGLDPIVKSEFSAMRCPEFAQRLEALNKKSLVVVGIETHVCVAQMVLHALSRYRVHVLADAVGSRSPDNWRVALERMRQAGAVISSTEMAMYELMERAGTDEFRAVLPLVKGA